jgi:MFS family permease
MATQNTKNLRWEIKRFYTLFAISQFLIDSSIWSFYLTEYCRFSLTEAVAFHAGTTAVSGILDLPTGSWADRFGRKRVVLLGFIARAIAATLMIVASSTPVLILAAIANGFGWAQLSGAMEAFLHDNLRARGEEASFRRYMSNSVMINYCSRTAAFVLSGVLFTLHPTLPYATLAIALIIGAHCTASIKELPFEKTNATADREHIIQGARVFLDDNHLLKISALMLAGMVLAEQIWFSIQPLLLAAHMRPFDVGLSYALGALGSVLGARIGKELLTRHRDEVAFSLSLVFCACGAVVFAVVEKPSLLVIAQLITCVGFGLIAASRGSILNSHLPSAHRAVCLSIFSTSEAILIGLFGVSLGYLYENLNRAIPPTAVALLCLILVYPTFRALRRAPRSPLG